jgi:hypothetical protein
MSKGMFEILGTKTLGRAVVEGQGEERPRVAKAGVGRTSSSCRLGWFQRLSQLWAYPFVGRSQPRPLWLTVHWDPHHEHLQPRLYDSCQDILARECHDAMRMALYHTIIGS